MMKGKQTSTEQQKHFKDESAVKRCSKCGESKLFIDYSKDKSKKDGYSNICKSCKIIYFKKYKAEHLDKLRESQKKWSNKSKSHYQEYYRKNREVISSKNKIYREKNREKIRIAWLKYYNMNREKILERACKYRESDKGKKKLMDYLSNGGKEKQKQYRKTNRAKLNEWYRSYYNINRDEWKRKWSPETKAHQLFLHDVRNYFGVGKSILTQKQIEIYLTIRIFKLFHSKIISPELARYYYNNIKKTGIEKEIFKHQLIGK